MEVVCSGCNNTLGRKPGDGISHTICSQCIVTLYGDLYTEEELKALVEKTKAEEKLLRKS